MAHIMTGERDLWFDPSRIVTVTMGTGGHGAAISGITDGVVEVADAPAAFLQGLGIANQFAQLTRPDNSPVWMKAGNVAWVRAPLQGEHPPAVQSVVGLGGRLEAVTEALQVAVNMLKQAGALI